ncbi:hypothetical protein ONZ51_g12975 [Trametes cubensis]|uniref:YCII-related domain-containing protein n=1 Tax=Trametes cubensis TaxID=1111947 RepID=A0AAD7X4G5_9APHY|nr:hypothetical protein ONZ51_g12975 [Trametes cubensis]
MASGLPKLTKNYFLVYAPDLPNAQRAKHVPEHIVHNTPLIKNGIIKLGGGLLSSDAKSTDADAHDKLDGSFIIVHGESIEEVWALIKKDVFYTSGEVWDRSKIIIKPVFLAIQDTKFE